MKCNIVSRSLSSRKNSLKFNLCSFIFSFRTHFLGSPNAGLSNLSNTSETISIFKALKSCRKYSQYWGIEIMSDTSTQSFRITSIMCVKSFLSSPRLKVEFEGNMKQFYKNIANIQSIKLHDKREYLYFQLLNKQNKWKSK